MILDNKQVVKTTGDEEDLQLQEQTFAYQSLIKNLIEDRNVEDALQKVGQISFQMQ